MSYPVRAASLILILASTAMVAGCTADASAFPDEELASVEQPIKGGNLLPPFSPLAQSTVTLFNCTGTIIGPRHVLSAAHCAPVVGGQIGFYDGSVLHPSRRTIRTVYIPHGVDLSKQPPPDIFASQLANWDAGKSDSAGKYADIVVLELDARIPDPGRIALLPTTYLGSAPTGTMLGSGTHDGAMNTSRELRFTTSKVYSSDDHDGHMLTDSADVNPGDSGGPFFTRRSGRPVVHGALSGTRWEWAQRGKYTSVSFHLNRILWAMGEVQLPANLVYPAVPYRTESDGSLDDCRVACMQDARCQSYHFETATGICARQSAELTGVWPQRRLGLRAGFRRTAGTAPCTLVGGMCRM